VVPERLNKTMKIIRVTGTQNGRTCVAAARAYAVNNEVAVSYTYLVRVLIGLPVPMAARSKT
jgi:hypothetical protein